LSSSDAANTDNQWYPQLPLPRYTKDGVQVRMSQQEYYDYLKLRGEEAVALMPDNLNFDNPTKEDIDRVQKAFERATDTAKWKMGFVTGRPTHAHNAPVVRSAADEKR
jgi:hypothetical protein